MSLLKNKPTLLNIKRFNILRPVLAAIFLSAILMAGCKKEKDGIGDGVLPDESLLGVNRIDTVTLRTSTLLDDSVRADGLGSVILGSINDPQFGITRAGFYTQVMLSTNLVNFSAIGDTLAVDSVVLALVYANGQYGFDFPQEYEVYELNQRLFSDSIYFSNRTLATKSQNLVMPESSTQRPDPDNNVTLISGSDTIESPPQLRLRLDHEIGERIIDASDNDSLTSALFPDFMKGFYVTVSDQYIPVGNGGIHYYNLENAASKLTVYFHSTQDSIPQSFDLNINSNSVYFSKPIHDFTPGNPDLNAQLAGDQLNGQQNVFIQAAAGLKVKVDLPYLDQLNSDTLAINRAILVVPYEENNIFAPPGRLFAIGRNTDGTAYLLPDFNEGDAHIGGFLNVANKEYRINISRWVQQIISGTRELGTIELVSAQAGTSANRAIIFGPEHTERKMRLVLDYTKF